MDGASGGGDEGEGDPRGTYNAIQVPLGFPRGDDPKWRFGRIALNGIAALWGAWFLYSVLRSNLVLGLALVVGVVAAAGVSLRLRRHGLAVVVTDEGVVMPWRLGRNRMVRWEDVESIPEVSRFDEQIHVIMRDQRVVYIPGIPPQRVREIGAFARAHGAGDGTEQPA